MNFKLNDKQITEVFGKDKKSMQEFVNNHENFKRLFRVIVNDVAKQQGLPILPIPPRMIDNALDDVVASLRTHIGGDKK